MSEKKDDFSIPASQDCVEFLKEVYTTIEKFKTVYHMCDEPEYVQRALSELYHGAVSNPDDDLTPGERGDYYLVQEQIPRLLEDLQELNTQIYLKLKLFTADLPPAKIILPDLPSNKKHLC